MRALALLTKITASCRKAQSFIGRTTLFLRRIIATALIAAIFLYNPLSVKFASAERTDPVSLQQLTAVYLYNFLYFVTWPDNKAPQPATTPFTIGILGRSSVKQALQTMEKSLQNSKKRDIKLVYYDRYIPGLDFTDCHIVFISSSENDHFPEIVNDLKNAPILSVAQDDAFLAAGGMITIQEHQHKLRYKINRNAASEAGLRLSSQLLKSALSF